MKVQGHLRNYPLTDLFKILANRRESGCLQIEFDQPALLYFNKGVLVAARIADLEGISAIRLACSRANAPFVFDNAILPPAAANIDESDRRVLSRVFGLVFDVAGPDPQASTRPAHRVAVRIPAAPNSLAAATRGQEAVKNNLGSTAEITPARQAQLNRDPSPTILKKETANFTGSSPRQEAPLRSSSATVKRRTQKVAKSFKIASNLLAVTKQTFDYLPSRKLLRAATVILVIAVPATVGLTLRLGKRGPAAPVVVEAKQTTSPEAPGTTIVSRVEDKLPATPLAETPAPALTPTKVQAVETLSPGSKTPAPVIERNTRSATTGAPLSDEPKIIEESTSVAQPSAAVVEEAKPAPVVIPERKPESVSKTIVVVVRVEEGRVTEAWVRDSHRGSEAFEATAIRLARQRRYSKDTSRTEAVPISVTVNQ